MKCETCNKTFDSEEMREHLGRNLCEDCYMDALTPDMSCDPWAVLNARACTGEEELPHIINETQAHILNFLEKSGGAEPSTMASELKIDLPELLRELAVLRHMEKIRSEFRKGKQLYRMR